MIYIKSRAELKIMEQACKITRDTLDLITSQVRTGVTTKQLDKLAKQFIKSRGAIPSFYNYRGYPANICTSINHVVIHGIPSEQTVRDGDIVSIDIAAYYKGFHGDAARTIIVGNASNEAESLVRAAEESFYEGLKYAREGNRLQDISSAIEQYVTSKGFSVVREFVGHGVGKSLHEDPSVPNFGRPGRGVRLKKGMTLAIEPMVNAGTSDVALLKDKWTVVTKDKKLSAHYENTVAITDGEPMIMTL